MDFRAKRSLIFKVISAVCLTVFFFGSSAFAATKMPNDTYVDRLWYLSKIGAIDAWNTTLGFEGITVAVIDSGVDIDHPDLRDNMWTNPRETPGNGIDDDGNGFVDDVYGWDFFGNTNDPRPDISGDYDVLAVNHGTIAAGLIAAKGDNAAGVVGVTWQTRIMAIRALDSNGYGDPVQIARAVNYAINNGAKVINLSFVGQSYSNVLDVAVRHAYDVGVVVVAAAGNAPDGGAAVDLASAPLYPVCFDRASTNNYVIGVAATDEVDNKASFSNYGAGCVDISAPGVRILATQMYRPRLTDFVEPYGGYYNGTSLAAPIVAGAVALLKSLDSTMTPKQVLAVLSASADKIDGQNPLYVGKLGVGRLNVGRAVQIVVAEQAAKSALSANVARAGGVLSTRTLISRTLSPQLVVVAPGAGRPGEVRIFSQGGLFVRSFFPFGEGFVGGVGVTTANATGRSERRDEIVVAIGRGAEPRVRVYTLDGVLLADFLVYEKTFRGGVGVTAIDLNGDGVDELVVRALDRSRRAKVFSLGGGLMKMRAPSVAAANVVAENRAMFKNIAGSVSGATPVVTLTLSSFVSPLQFYVYEKNFLGGVQAALLTDGS